MKSGTTSLHAYLAAHPQVFMAKPKELRFFSGQNWDRGIGWYEQHFQDAGDAGAVGEASPAYSRADLRPGTAQRVAEVLPAAQLVYLVREPIERMLSNYVQAVASGQERRPAAQAFRESDFYLNTSRYRWQLDQYLPHFPRDHFLVITSESLRHRPEATLRQVYGFLGVDASWVPPNLDEGRQSTVHRRRRTRLGHLDRFGWYRAAWRSAPAPLRRLVQGATTRPIHGRATELPDDLRIELRQRLRPDVAGLREFLPPEWDGWGMV